MNVYRKLTFDESLQLTNSLEEAIIHLDELISESKDLINNSSISLELINSWIEEYSNSINCIKSLIDNLDNIRIYVKKVQSL